MPSDIDDLVRLRSWLATGEAVRIRERARLKRGELAKELGISYARLQKYELKERVPSGKVAQRYAKLLGRLSRDVEGKDR